MIVIEENSHTLKGTGPKHIETHQQIRVEVPIPRLDGFTVRRQDGREENRI
jgi:hypothetical protein